MQAQVFEGYFENGQFFSQSKSSKLKGRYRAVLTVVLDEQIHDDTDQSWIDELNEMIAADTSEKLRPEDFPRANFSRVTIEVKP